MDDELLKFEYNNVCFEKCPKGSNPIYQKEYICQKDVKCEEYNVNISKCKERLEQGYYIDEIDGIYKPCHKGCKTCYGPGDNFNKNCIEFITDLFLEEFHSIINNFNTTEIERGIDFIHKEDNTIFTFTTSANQRNNKYYNVTIIDLGECEKNIRKEYNISEKEYIYILKIDIYLPGALYPKIEYELYFPLDGKNLTLLNLTVCENVPFDIYLPVNLSKSDLDKYNAQSRFYNDICYTHTSDNGTDIPLKDRRKDFIDNNLSICEEDCQLADYNENTKSAKCTCPTKIKLPIISEVKIDKQRFLKNFIDIKNTINIKLLKCIYLLFDVNNILKNFANYIGIFLFVFSIISLFIFTFKSYRKIKAFITIIYKHRKSKNQEKKKNDKNNQNKNKDNMQNNEGNKSLDKNKQINKRRKTIKHRSETVNYNERRKRYIGLKIPDKEEDIKRENKNRNVYINSLQINNINQNDSNINSKSSLNKNIRKINKNRKKVSSKRPQRQNIIDNLRNSKINRVNTNAQKRKKIYKKVLKSDKYNEAELNILNYKKALKHDKRTYFKYYLSLLRTQHIFIFSFCNFKDYNSSIIKMYIFFFTYWINYSISAMFYSESTMHKIYENGGAFDIIYQIPNMLYSSVLSLGLINVIKTLGLCQNDVMKIKNCKYKKIQKNINMSIKRIKLKIILFFIITYVLLFALWIYSGCFCAVYKNTQIHLIKEVSSSFGISLITPFFIALIPGIFRIHSLKNKKKDSSLMYKFSLFLQKLC